MRRALRSEAQRIEADHRRVQRLFHPRRDARRDMRRTARNTRDTGWLSDRDFLRRPIEPGEHPPQGFGERRRRVFGSRGLADAAAVPDAVDARRGDPATRAHDRRPPATTAATRHQQDSGRARSRLPTSGSDSARPTIQSPQRACRGRRRGRSRSAAPAVGARPSAQARRGRDGHRPAHRGCRFDRGRRPPDRGSARNVMPNRRTPATAASPAESATPARASGSTMASSGAVWRAPATSSWNMSHSDGKPFSGGSAASAEDADEAEAPPSAASGGSVRRRSSSAAECARVDHRARRRGTTVT